MCQLYIPGESIPCNFNNTIFLQFSLQLHVQFPLCLALLLFALHGHCPLWWYCYEPCSTQMMHAAYYYFHPCKLRWPKGLLLATRRNKHGKQKKQGMGESFEKRKGRRHVGTENVQFLVQLSAVCVQSGSTCFSPCFHASGYAFPYSC